MAALGDKLVILLALERSAAKGYDVVVQRAAFPDDRRLQLAESGLAVPVEDFLDRLAGLLDDSLVHVHERLPEPVSQLSADRRLAAPSIANQKNAHFEIHTFGSTDIPGPRPWRFSGFSSKTILTGTRCTTFT